MGTGKEQRITITAPNKLSKEEIERKIKEAEQHAEEDKKRQEEIEIRNNADSMIYTSEKTIEELGDKVDADKKSQIENLIKELRELIAGNDLDSIKSKTDELAKIVQEIGAAIYQEAQQAQQETEAQSQETPNQDNDETIDADYEVKK